VSANNFPAMSVVVIPPDTYQRIRRLVQCLANQTIKENLEIIFIVNSLEKFTPDPGDVSGFANWRIIQGNDSDTMGVTRAAGVFAARAPVVVMTENHCYPDPEWAEMLVRAHQQPWGAVGPAVNLVLPASPTNWAMHWLGYSRWMEPVRAGVIDDLPGHNSSYKRDALMYYGAQLGAMLEIETILHWDMQQRGLQLYLEPAAKTYHGSLEPENVLQEFFYYGRAFAAQRSKGWSWGSRLIYALGAPLIPLIRFRRILRDVRRADKSAAWFAPVIPPLILGLITNALGEMLGYLFGIGNSLAVIKRNELYSKRSHKETGRLAGTVRENPDV